MIAARIVAAIYRLQFEDIGIELGALLGIRCADGKWRDRREANYFTKGWVTNATMKGSRKADRLSFAAGFSAREKGRK